MNYTNFTINALVAANNSQQQHHLNHHQQHPIGKASSSRTTTALNRLKCPPSVVSNLNLIKNTPIRQPANFLNTPTVPTLGLPMNTTAQTRLHLTPQNHQQALVGDHINPLMRNNQTVQSSWNPPILDVNHAGSVFLQNMQKSLPDAVYFHQHLQRSQPINQLMVASSPLAPSENRNHEQQALDVFQTGPTVQNQQQLNSDLTDNTSLHRGRRIEEAEVDLSLQKNFQSTGSAMKEEDFERNMPRDGLQIGQQVKGNQNNNDDNNSNNVDNDDEDDDDDDDDEDDDNSRRRVRKTKIPKTVSSSC